MTDIAGRPTHRSDLVLVELRDDDPTAPACLRTLQDRGQLAGVDPVWQPFDRRIARTDEASPWRAANDVDPRVRERLHQVLARVRILRLRDAPARLVIEACNDDARIARAGLVPLRLACAARRRTRVDATWNLDAIRMRQARRADRFKDAADIHVAMLDTGLDVRHPDLRGFEPRLVHAYGDVPFEASPRDIPGHGTHLAGTILGRRKNRVGLRGMCDCRLSSFKVFGDTLVFVSAHDGFHAAVDERAYLAALALCIEERVDVVQLGFASRAIETWVETELFTLLAEFETTIVAGMGNDREQGSPTTWPAAAPGAIAIAASSIDDAVAAFSSAGPHVAIAAPGVAIWSTAPTAAGTAWARYDPELGPGRPGPAVPRGQRYMAADGTSCAAAHVTAAVALLFANRGKDTPARVRERLLRTAFKPRSRRAATFDHDLGAGILDVEALLAD